jgi:hypothetical protein
MAREFTELTWGAFKEAIDAVATDETYIQSIRQINPGTPLEDLSISVSDVLGLDID